MNPDSPQYQGKWLRNQYRDWAFSTGALRWMPVLDERGNLVDQILEHGPGYKSCKQWLGEKAMKGPPVLTVAVRDWLNRKRRQK